jgi:diaminopimelate epimerase
MEVTVSKHHGLGNDFLVYDVAQGIPSRPWPEVAVQLCDRRMGVGADGLLVLQRQGNFSASMALFNSDGSRAEMSGNGIRCLVQAAYLADAASGECTYLVTTDAGEREVQVLGEPVGGLQSVVVDMGVIEEIEAPTQWSLLEAHPDRPVRHVSLGNPHSVVAVDDVKLVDLEALGAKVPEVNLEVVEPGPESHAITMRVHERGAGVTLACGTGACASAEAALSWGIVPSSTNEVLVHMDGGDARVRIDATSRRATLIGPTQFIATVTVNV